MREPAVCNLRDGNRLSASGNERARGCSPVAEHGVQGCLMVMALCLRAQAFFVLLSTCATRARWLQLMGFTAQAP